MAVITSVLQMAISYTHISFLYEREWFNYLDLAFCVLMSIYWLIKLLAALHKV